MNIFLRSNQISNSVYNYYLKNLVKLEASARRVATGERLATLKDGGGEMGVADNYRVKVSKNDTLLTGLTLASSYVELQGEVIDQADEIINDMLTLAGDALNTTLSTTDRIALDTEFQALESEFTSLLSRQFNALSLFGQDLTVRVGIESGQTQTIGAISLNLITFTGMTISQIALASAALQSLDSRLSSLNIFKGRSGAAAASLDRTTSFIQSVKSNLENVEDSIRDIDLATETGIFTQEQVVLASAQSVLSQSNNLIQSLLTFLS